MRFGTRVARVLLPSALVLTVACGLAYVGIQQTYRNGADDPQVQLAEDAAARLAAGEAPGDVVPAGSVDLAHSLAPFVIVYDAQNEPVAGSGTLDAAPPVPPVGVLGAARKRGSNRVTWQPRPAVRIASYEVAASDGTVVLAGRSLREVERRVSQLTSMAAIAWLLGLAGLLVMSVLFARAEGGSGSAAADDAV
jgi:hypothetical protein